MAGLASPSNRHDLTTSGDDRLTTTSAPGVLWSPAEMTERLGGDGALARELVVLFLDEHGKLLANLRKSVGAGTADDVRRAAHAAKGCIANFMDSGPQETALRIEQMAAGGQLAGVPRLLAQLESEVDVLVRQMQAFVRDTPCAS